MKLFRTLVTSAAVITALVLAGCAQAESSPPPPAAYAPPAPPALTSGAVLVADFSEGLDGVTVTKGHNGLDGVTGTYDASVHALKVTYGGSVGFGQTNIIIPNPGTDFSGYASLTFTFLLKDQPQASFLPVLRGTVDNWNDAWAGTQTDSGAPSYQEWKTVTIPVSSFAAQSWGSTVTAATASDAFEDYPNFDLVVLENAYNGTGSTTNADGNLKTLWITNIAFVPAAD